ncbi:hypothetical protein [Vibrio splendidus]|uniref:hypothetical protein n=1 Tax=Vibrio splendidus TaxID=29497 RepID=UPI000C8253A9|nr:hypothetical protein [Vibrio splendidus]PMP51627.1 hypothetical protein BCS83_02170 [Vibrio splendidus]
MSLTRGAAQLCQRPVFHRFLAWLCHASIASHEQAAEVLRRHLNIASRRELDQSQEAAERYRYLIRQFNDWMSWGNQ